MFDCLAPLQTPGLIVTATDTDVGKTVAACAVARSLRQTHPRLKVGVCKPFATGCRRQKEGLVSEDALALAHFSDCRAPLDTIAPIRYEPPLAPAVAAEQTGQPIDVDALARSLVRLEREHDVLIIEGVGGVMAPLSESQTVLDFILALNSPVIVVARAGLGTLNHTAMTVQLLRQAGCNCAGVVINGRDDEAHHNDPSVVDNRRWIEKITRLPVLAELPSQPSSSMRPAEGVISSPILDAASQVDWLGLMQCKSSDE